MDHDRKTKDEKSAQDDPETDDSEQTRLLVATDTQTDTDEEGREQVEKGREWKERDEGARVQSGGGRLGSL